MELFRAKASVSAAGGGGPVMGIRRRAIRRNVIFLTIPLFPCSSPSSVRPATRFMAPKNACAKYQYVVTPNGPRIIPVTQTTLPKDEESPADYNSGGYLPVKLRDSFKDGRYVVIRKLGYAFPTHSLRFPPG